MVKVSELTADTSPTGDDLLYGVNNPSGTPTSKKWTLDNTLNYLLTRTQTWTGSNTFSQTLTMNGADINIGANKLKTTSYDLFENSVWMYLDSPSTSQQSSGIDIRNKYSNISLGSSYLSVMVGEYASNAQWIGIYTDSNISGLYTGKSGTGIYTPLQIQAGSNINSQFNTDGTTTFNYDVNIGANKLKTSQYDIYGDGNTGLVIKSNVANQSSWAYLLPNGTANDTVFELYNSPDMNNSSLLSLSLDATKSALYSYKTGTGTAKPLYIQVGVFTNATFNTDGTTTFGNPISLGNNNIENAELPTDTNFFVDSTDETKKLAFGLSGFTTATTRTITIPNANTTLVGTDVTQTLTNKTIDGDNNTISNLAIGAEVSTALTQTEEIWIPAGSFTSATTNGAQITSRETTTNKVNYHYAGFDTTTSESAWFTWTPPANWNAGTMRFKLYWTNTAGATTQTIDFDLAGVAITDDGALDVALGTAQNVTDVWLAQNDLHITAFSSAITIGGTPTAGKEIHFKLSRDVASDNMAGDADVIGVLLEYTVNDIGTT